MNKRTALGALAAALLLPACLSALKPGDAPRVRYFSAVPVPGAVTARADEMPSLRLRHVGAAAHLRERMVWRSSEVEYGYYETRRWTDLPAAMLEEALARELFETRGLRRTEAALAHALDVELRAFEERTGEEPAARVALVARLFDADGTALMERTFEASVAIEREEPAAIARAMSRALGEVVRTVASEVARQAAGG